MSRGQGLGQGSLFDVIWGGGRARAGSGLYSEVQCMMGNGNMGPP